MRSSSNDMAGIISRAIRDGEEISLDGYPEGECLDKYITPRISVDIVADPYYIWFVIVDDGVGYRIPRTESLISLIRRSVIR